MHHKNIISWEIFPYKPINVRAMKVKKKRKKKNTGWNEKPSRIQPSSFKVGDDDGEEVHGG